MRWSVGGTTDKGGGTTAHTIYSSRILRCPRKQTDAHIDTSFVQYIKLHLTTKYIALPPAGITTTTTTMLPLYHPYPRPRRRHSSHGITMPRYGIPPAMQRHYSRGKSARKMTLILYRRPKEEKQRNQQTPGALYPRRGAMIFRWNFDKKYAHGTERRDALLLGAAVRPRRIIQAVPR